MKRPAALRDRSFFFAATAGIRRADTSFQKSSPGNPGAGSFFQRKTSYLCSGLNKKICKGQKI